MRNFLTRLMTEEEGATMVEYALMVALIAAAAVAGVRLIGTTTLSTFNSVAGNVGVAGGGN